MYENQVHTVPNRIVSISQHYIRPITAHCPKRVLADKSCRNRENLTYCKLRGIRLSAPSLGSPKKNAMNDKKTEYVDNGDRVEVERSFSLAKRCYSLGKIMTKLDVTTRSSIVLFMSKNAMGIYWWLGFSY